ncbi:hypothetical protein KUF83_30390 [Streptomyces sp. BV286]|uniref:hypothetical protein n=1 Tax=Streptomyces sp. BV286 TaxID=2849672 RepID=UPI001C2F0DB5|nr:hypothetical protein [Streptomyces sp. BV286]MBV1940846.1 hypothetical protein [Streptomyces sp. BV286]
MAAVPRRAERLRKVAWKLTEQYGLPRDRQIEAEIDDYARPKRWTFVWRDGPTETQLRRAAAQLDKEALDGVGCRREYSDTAYAVAAIRCLRDGDPGEDPYHAGVSVYDAGRLLDTTKNPGPSDDRERHMAARLVKASERRPSVYGDGDAICREATEKGLSPLLRGEDAPALTPIELLTERYARGSASALWMYRLTPVTPLEAFAAVQADEKASPEHIAAALTLLPELHAALDAAAASLQERLSP